MKKLLSQVSGAFGDLGTLVPLLVALSQTGQVKLPASLLFGGLFNILSGLIFDIPLCVQPMKSIGSIALLSNLTKNEICAAGLSVSSPKTYDEKIIVRSQRCIW